MLSLHGNWENRSWEQLPAGIQGKAPNPSHGCWVDLGLWLLSSAKWREQESGEAHEGKKGLVEWQFYSKFSSKRSSHKERGSMGKVMQIKQPGSSYTSHKCLDVS